MSERKQINFTIVPDDESPESRTYANFCSISHTPFDFILTFCEVLPPTEKAVREAASRSGVESAGTGTDRRPHGIRAEPDQRAAGAPARLHRVRWEPGLGQAGRALLRESPGKAGEFS